MPRAEQVARSDRTRMIADAQHKQTHVRSQCDRCGQLRAGVDGAQHAFGHPGHAVTVSVLHSAVYFRPVLDDSKSG